MSLKINKQFISVLAPVNFEHHQHVSVGQCWFCCLRFPSAPRDTHMDKIETGTAASDMQKLITIRCISTKPHSLRALLNWRAYTPQNPVTLSSHCPRLPLSLFLFSSQLVYIKGVTKHKSHGQHTYSPYTSFVSLGTCWEV